MSPRSQQSLNSLTHDDDWFGDDFYEDCEGKSGQEYDDEIDFDVSFDTN